jgi:hypothetical protein
MTSKLPTSMTMTFVPVADGVQSVHRLRYPGSMCSCIVTGQADMPTLHLHAKWRMECNKYSCSLKIRHKRETTTHIKQRPKQEPPKGSQESKDNKACSS